MFDQVLLSQLNKTWRLKQAETQGLENTTSSVSWLHTVANYGSVVLPADFACRSSQAAAMTSEMYWPC